MATTALDLSVPWFPIQTERLLLREFELRDEEDVHMYGSDPEVCRFTAWGPNSVEDTRTVIAQRRAAQLTWPRNRVELALEHVGDGRVIGSIMLDVVSRENRAAELGYAMNREFWNGGYATEAAAAVVDRAFSQLKLHRVFATCDARNLASVRVLEKLGFRREGHFRLDVLQKGEWRDSFLYALLESRVVSSPAQ